MHVLLSFRQLKERISRGQDFSIFEHRAYFHHRADLELLGVVPGLILSLCCSSSL